eukprot:GILJ01006250.1.p1 GENE.GILJ01006250.1~~GILJ01006250.1.p1  ORF type:complete len:662 (-),score=69.28 GILJ01006250.1:97-2082(-)
MASLSGRVKRSPRTRTALLQKRKQDMLPHISMDLDGDGVVGPRDLVIGTLFDVDRDGKLNDQERAAALEAIRQGVENKFSWNHEQAGAKRTYRLMQRRGKILIADDYTELTETYPRHPMSDTVPSHSTRTDLLEDRKSKCVQEIQDKTASWDALHPQMLEDRYVQREDWVPCPRHPTQSAKVAEANMQARVAAGLESKTTDINAHRPHTPTLNWNTSPTHNSRLELLQARKQQLQTDMETAAAETERVFNTTKERRNANEEEKLRARENQAEGKTKTKLEQERRHAERLFNEQNFAKITFGVHGKELPAFSEADGFWWEKSPDHCPDNVGKSAFAVRKQRLGSSCDPLSDSQYTDTAAPADPFKREHVALPKRRTEACEKITSMKFSGPQSEVDLDGRETPRDYDGLPKRKVPSKRWSTQMLEYTGSAGTKRLFDNLAPVMMRKEDYLPVYSSFKVDKPALRPHSAAASTAVTLNDSRRNSNDYEASVGTSALSIRPHSARVQGPFVPFTESIPPVHPARTQMMSLEEIEKSFASQSRSVSRSASRSASRSPSRATTRPSTAADRPRSGLNRLGSSRLSYASARASMLPPAPVASAVITEPTFLDSLLTLPQDPVPNSHLQSHKYSDPTRMAIRSGGFQRIKGSSHIVSPVSPSHAVKMNA